MRRTILATTLLLQSLAASAALGDLVQDEVNDLKATPTPQATGRGRSCKSNDVLDGITFSWCFEKGSTRTDRRKILYYLHGAGGNQYSLIDSSWYARIREDWKTANVLEPIVVSVSFGPRWLLTDLPSSYVVKHPVLTQFFVEKVMPYIEEKITSGNVINATDRSLGSVTGGIAQRFLMGASMGSYNAALLAERRSDLFRKVVLGCPAFFTTVNPFSSSADVEAYVARTGADAPVVKNGLQILGADVQSRTLDDWERNNPLALATKLSPLSPAILVWYNLRDAFGFAEGAAEFANSAALLGAPADPPVHNAGVHCQIDTDIEARIAQFLQ